MGRKQGNAEAKPAQEPKEAKKEEAKKEEEEPEDTPIVKELKVIDDEYLKVEREYEQEVAKLQREYELKQAPMLEERRKKLAEAAEGGASTGTPALSGFWLKALANHPAFEEVIQEWDAPVLEFLQDITKGPLDDAENYEKGFKLCFHFMENPYFEQTLISKEYHTEETSPYTGEVSVKLIKTTDIVWKTGKDVTVEKVAKAVKGGGAKKAKQKKTKEEPRDSFFRMFFRTLKEDDEMPPDIMQMMLGEREDDEDEDDDEMLMEFMDNDHEIGMAVKDQIIPFAVRWYTGEAAPEGDDDDDEDSEEEDDDDDDDDDDDESEDEPAPKGKKGNKKGAPAPKKKGGSSNASPAGGPKEKEECKQQ